MDGSITVKTTIGMGSTFIVVVPIELVEEGAEEQEVQSDSDPEETS